MRAAFPLVLLLALGCDPEPEDPFFMRGSAFGSDGAPLANAVLLLERTDLLTQDGPQPFAAITTDPHGNFLHVFEHRELRPIESINLSFHLRRPPKQGSRTVLDFTYYGRADFRLPPFRDVFVPVTVDDTTLSFQSPTLDTGEAALDMLEVYSGDALVWREVVTSGTAHVLPTLFEDFPELRTQIRAVATGQLIFKSLLLDSWADVTYAKHTYSQPVDVVLEPLVPVSRGARCSFPAAVEGPCPLTDGKLDKVTVVAVDDGTGAAEAERQEIRIDLDAPHTLRHLVVRGLDAWSTDLIVETSTDGATWTRLVAFDLTQRLRHAFGPEASLLSEAFADIALAPSGPVRHLRLVATPPSEDGASSYIPFFAREISLFE